MPTNPTPKNVRSTLGKNQERHFFETSTAEEWIKSLQEWSDSHSLNTPLLSDEAVSRRGIYEEI